MYLSKRILALSILTLFMVAVFFSLNAAMMTDSQGNMSNCPFTNGMSSICRMNVFEHITRWQSLFAATIPTVILLFFALTLLLVDSSFENLSEANSLKEKSLRHQRQNFILQLFDHLQFAFRKGILHSKVFSFASISH